MKVLLCCELYNVEDKVYPSGVSWHRLVLPHSHYNPNVVDVQVTNNIQEIERLGQLHEYSIIIFTRHFGGNAEQIEINYKLAKKYGACVILDVDDYWHFPADHLNYHIHLLQQYGNMQKRCLELADIVTTTTDLLAENIKEYNPNVVVLPNGLTEEDVSNENSVADRIRIGWVGGAAHTSDMPLLKDSINKLYNTALPFQMVLCGFNLSKATRYVYGYYEKIFTGDYKDMDREKMQSTQDAIQNDRYKRVLSLKAHEYMNFYNDLDIVIAPLHDNYFNQRKSELKMIEAGFKKKPIIVSNIYPYKYLITKKNCLSVKPNKNHEWFDSMKKLIESKAMREDLGNQLYEDVKDKYNLKIINKKRLYLYENIERHLRGHKEV